MTMTRKRTTSKQNRVVLVAVLVVVVVVVSTGTAMQSTTTTKDRKMNFDWTLRLFSFQMMNEDTMAAVNAYRFIDISTVFQLYPYRIGCIWQLKVSIRKYSKP